MIGLVKFGVHYMFSQRRVDITDIVSNAEERIRREERQRLIGITEAPLKTVGG